MKKILVVFVAIIGTGFLVAFFTYYSSVISNPHLEKYQVSDVSWEATTITVYRALTKEQQEKGLGGIAYLPPDHGMLFEFSPPSDVGFWMKNMKISIDIAWVDEEMEVIHIEHNVSPDTYPALFYAHEPAMYVLELASGVSKKTNLEIGTKIKIEP